MVSMIENWSDVTGTIVSVDASSGPATAYLKVKDIEPVDEFPNLLSADSGHELAVSLRPEQVEAARSLVGKEITLRLRRGGPEQVFVKSLESRDGN